MLNLEYCIIVRFLLHISFFSFILTTVWEGMSTTEKNKTKQQNKTKQKKQQIRKSVAHNKNS